MHSHLRGHPALILASKYLEQLNPDQFEIYYEHRTSTKVDSKNQEVENLSRSEDVGLAIRLIKDRKLGFSFTTSLEDKAIHQAIHTAINIAKYMPEDEHLGFSSFGNFVYPNIDNCDHQGLKTSIQEKIQLAKHLEAQCRKADRRITNIRSATLNETFLETHLVDSNGEHLEHQATGYSASVTCKAEENGDSQMGGDYYFSNDFSSLDIESVAQSAAQQAVELLGAKPGPTAQCPAILRNSVTADLIEFLSASFSAEQIEKGRSLLAGKRGQLLFSERVTLIDDGLLPGGMGTTPFDGEGIPSRKTTLVDGGFISGTLYDSYFAKKLGSEPTGSSIRGIKSPPSIGFSNLYLKKGTLSAESLIQGLDDGILITDLMGVHTANPVTGDFSLGASGILIKKGKLVQPVRGIAVAGNVLELFRQVLDVGADLKFFGKIGAPSISVRELSISGV